ncbi:MAG: YobH family protein [Gammaproteobacteria bacterium]|nr:YobH family protein [Gammaproteobacteria bacterium]
MSTLSSFIALLIIAVIALLATDSKVLFSETLAMPGQYYFVDDFGNLGRHKQATLHCKYFTGRKIVNRVYWYSPNKTYGRDSCPALLTD